MNGFEKKFLKILTEDEYNDESMTDTDTPTSDKEAFDASLDPDTPTGQFDDVPENPVAEFEASQRKNAVGVLGTWVGNVESFIEQLNGLDGNSMNAQLQRTDCGSILADVRRSESKKISRIAQDLSSLGESLKQYLMTAQNEQSD